MTAQMHTHIFTPLLSGCRNVRLFCNCHSAHVRHRADYASRSASERRLQLTARVRDSDLSPLSQCVESFQRLDRIGNLSLNTQIPSLNPIKTNTHSHTHIQILSQRCLVLSLWDLIQITRYKVRVLIWILSSASFKYTSKHTLL